MREVIEQKPSIRIKDWELLRRLDAGGEGVESEYELENRFAPTRLLSAEELAAMEALEIEQAYGEAEDETGKMRSIRYRRTFGAREGSKLRIAEKTGIKNTRAKLERQCKISPEDELRREFDHLWNARDREYAITPKTRKYVSIRVDYPDPTTGKMKEGRCEIHYDTHHAEIEGLARIEVEFKGGDPDALEAYVLANGHRNFLPDWVGERISDENWFGGRNISRSLALIQKGERDSENVRKLLAEMERQKGLPVGPLK